jgi:hypothetical protein
MSDTDERGEAGGEKPWIPHDIADREGQLDPYPFFREIRDEAPLRYDPRRDTYDIVGYDAVVESITQHQRFTRRNTSYINGSLLSTGEPIHSELRGMARTTSSPAFSRSSTNRKSRSASTNCWIGRWRATTTSTSSRSSRSRSRS